MLRNSNFPTRSGAWFFEFLKPEERIHISIVSSSWKSLSLEAIIPRMLIKDEYSLRLTSKFSHIREITLQLTPETEQNGFWERNNELLVRILHQPFAVHCLIIQDPTLQFLKSPYNVARQLSPKETRITTLILEGSFLTAPSSKPSARFHSSGKTSGHDKGPEIRATFERNKSN